MHNIVKGLFSGFVLLLLISTQIFYFVKHSPKASSASYTKTAPGFEIIDKTIDLKNGNTISYTEHIYPKSSISKPEKCYPIIIFHDFVFLGSRFFFHPEENDLIRNLFQSRNFDGEKCLRILRFDRPGFGSSSALKQFPTYSAMLQEFFVPILQKNIFPNVEGDIHMSVIGIGGGVPVSLAFSALPTFKIDSLHSIHAFFPFTDALIDHFGVKIQNPTKNMCSFMRSFVKIENYFTKKGFDKQLSSLATNGWYGLIYRAMAQFGFVCNSFSWQNKYFNCLSDYEVKKLFDHQYMAKKKEDEEFSEENEDIKMLSMFNNTKTEEFRQGIEGVLSEWKLILDPMNWKLSIPFEKVAKNVENLVFYTFASDKPRNAPITPQMTQFYVEKLSTFSPQKVESQRISTNEDSLFFSELDGLTNAYKSIISRL